MRGQTGVLSERRGSYPFIDFRLLNSKCNPSFRSALKKKISVLKVYKPNCLISYISVVQLSSHSQH